MSQAIFVCQIKVISRSGGYSIVAGASYRSGERLVRNRTIGAKSAYNCGDSIAYQGQVFDYTNKGKHGVIGKGIVYPPGERHNWHRQYLWNLVEASEKRKDARLAREALVNLPPVLSVPEREELTTAFAEVIARRYRVVVDWAIHAPARTGQNHHAHLLFTTRRLEGGQLTEKTRELDDARRGPQEVTYLRKQWETLVNQKLAAKGLAVRVSSESLLAQGIVDRLPFHLSKEALKGEAKTGAKSAERLRWEQRQSEWERIYPHLAHLYRLGYGDTTVGQVRVSADAEGRLRIWEADELIVDYAPRRNIRRFRLTEGLTDFLETVAGVSVNPNPVPPWTHTQLLAARHALEQRASVMNAVSWAIELGGE